MIQIGCILTERVTRRQIEYSLPVVSNYIYSYYVKIRLKVLYISVSTTTTLTPGYDNSTPDIYVPMIFEIIICFLRQIYNVMTLQFPFAILTNKIMKVILQI